MNTFITHPNFYTNALCLDPKRLGGQRYEGAGVLTAVLNWETKGKGGSWPCVRFWVGYSDALKFYLNCIDQVWRSYGYQSNFTPYDLPRYIEGPDWLDDVELYKCMRKTLKFKTVATVHFNRYHKLWPGIVSEYGYHWAVSNRYHFYKRTVDTVGPCRFLINTEHGSYYETV